MVQCDACGTPIDDDDDDDRDETLTTYCAGCRSEWCDWCAVHNVHAFHFNGRARCTLCWKATPQPIKKAALLDLALRELGVTHTDLAKRLRAEQPELYAKPRDSYYCTRCPIGQCASRACEYVTEDFVEQPDPASDALQHHRGYCCVTWVADSGDALCDGCLRWRARRVARTLIGLRRFRPATLVAQLPRDVLVYALIKQQIFAKP